MAIKIDNKLLRNGDGAVVASYFRELQTKIDAKDVFQHLLDCIRSESIPSRVAALWLHGFADNRILAEAMRFEHSKMVRKAAIRRFGQRWRSKRLLDLWDDMGGAMGIMRLMTSLSVREVSQLCSVLGRSATVDTSRADRQRCMEELLKGLASGFFPESQLQNPERRPLLEYYTRLLPCCSVEMVQAWLSNDHLPAADSRRLCQAHPTFFQGRCLDKIASTDEKIDLVFYQHLFKEVPPKPATRHLSASLLFVLEVLGSLAKNDKIEPIPTSLLTSLAIPALRRLEKRRAPASLRATALNNLLQCLSVRPSECRYLSLTHDNLFGVVSRFWAENPDSYDPVLVRMLQLIPKNPIDLDIVAKSVARVDEALRERLLKHELLHIAGFGLDLDDDQVLLKNKSTWPSELFCLLPSGAAWDLLQRLKRLRPHGDFIAVCWPNDTCSLLGLDNRKQTTMHEILIQKKYNRDESHVRARQCVAEYKRKAATSREQQERADSAAWVLPYAVASGSLGLLEEIVLWLRRFNRDQLTLHTTYCSTVFRSNEMTQLLSGETLLLDQQISDIEIIKAHTNHANRIMLLLLETACMTLREPSFNAHSWVVVFELFALTTIARAANVRAFQEKLHLSDEDLYDSMFADTLKMLVRVEQVGLEENHIRLGLNKMAGPLGWKLIRNLPNLSHKVVCRFVDELAKQRNAIWERHRKAVRPTTVTLADPWTKGLPIQYLVPVQTHSTLPTIVSKMGAMHADRIPFLLSLAKKIVFLEGDSAMADQPDNDEIKAAIGPFVDDYKLALRLYVHSAVEGQSMETRAQKAWQHAFNKLSDPSLSKREAFFFWTSVFREASISLSSANARPGIHRDPVLPDVDDITQPTDWDPDPDRERLAHRSLRAKCLDQLLDATCDSRRGVESPFHQMRSMSPPEVQRSIWDEYELWRVIRPPIKEALIAATLLWINSKDCPNIRILAAPFPSKQDGRFPAIFLDDEFLEQNNPYSGVGPRNPVVRGLKSDVPPSLVLKLCQAMLDRLDGERPLTPGLEYQLFNYLKLIIAGDVPQASLEFISNVILKRPDDSSWHRQILTPALLKSLPAGIAKDFLKRLANGMVVALEKQAVKRASVKNDEEMPKPAVKITTIKMLAQMLAGADFFDEETTSELLLTLFMGSTHIDVRAAVVDSLVAMMLATKRKAIAAKILDALETHAVPVAAALNERQPLSEADWRQLASEGNVPEVAQGSSAFPVADSLIQAVDLAPDDRKPMLISRLLLPMLQQSAENNERWMSLFLPAYGFQSSFLNLPAVPARPTNVVDLIEDHIDLVPAEFLDTLSNASLITLQPSHELRAVNQGILTNPQLKSSNAGKHWLKLWHFEGVPSIYFYSAIIVSWLVEVTQTKIPNGITLNQVTQAAVRQLDAVIKRGDETLCEQNTLLQRLRPPFFGERDAWELWEQRVKPLVAHFIAKIDGLRSPEWQNDPDRKPAVLPDTYRMKLWLLSHPERRGRSGTMDEGELAVFADEVAVEIGRLARSGKPYEKPLQELTETTQVLESAYCFLACRLGALDAISDPPELADYLRIQVAEHFLRKGGEKDTPESHVLVANDLLDSWRACKHEDIRMRAIHMNEHIRKHPQQYWHKSWDGRK